MTWYRITWNGKLTRNRGFELIEAESEREARRKFLSLTTSRKIEKVQMVGDITDYEAEES